MNPGFAEQLDAATSREGMASVIDRNGIIAFTDRRLPWMPVAARRGLRSG